MSPIAHGLPVFDVEFLLSRLGGDVAWARDILESFLAAAPAQLEQVETAALQGDGTALNESAHLCKGGAVEIGGNALGVACSALITRHGPATTPLETRLATFRREHARLCESVRAYLGKPS